MRRGNSGPKSGPNPGPNWWLQRAQKWLQLATSGNYLTRRDDDKPKGISQLDGK